MTTLTGTYANGVQLSQLSDNPVTIANTASISSTTNGIALSLRYQPGSPFYWSATNYGRITASGSLSTGLYVEGGADIANGSGTASSTGWYILGGKFGISMPNDSGQVTNFGTVAATASGGYGISLDAGRVTNFGTVSGYSTGVAVGGGANASVANYVVIRATGSFARSGVLMTGTESNSLVNGGGGYIGTGTGGVGIGVLISKGTGTVDNRGTIESGVYLGAGGSVTNGKSGSSGGQITGDRGIDIRGTAGTTGAVTNYGTVATGGFNGVRMEAGTVRNAQSGALISADNQNGSAVMIYYGGPGKVSNLGTIKADGTNGWGVFIGGGGRVMNGSPTVKTALIEDDASPKATAVEFRNNAGTVNNFGTISGGYGVVLRDGGIIANMAPGATILGQYSGVRIDGPPAGRLTNLGTIAATGSVLDLNRSIAAAVLSEGGTVINGSSADHAATIDADGSSADHAATIDAGGLIVNSVIVTLAGPAFYGLTTGGPARVTNFGTIRGDTTGVSLAPGARLTNGPGGEAAALISGGQKYGIFAELDATAGDDITNFGTIAGGTGIGFRALLPASGLRAAKVAGSTITNAGTIIGDDVAIAFGPGDDRLIVDPGAKFNGVVFAGGGVDEIDFRKTGKVLLDPQYSGFSIVRLGDGAADRLVLTEADFNGITGALTVHGGNVSNSVDAGRLTPKHRLSYFGSAGKDTVTGGAGGDTFTFTARALTTADTILGGGGRDSLVVTTAGTVGVAGVSGVETFRLAPTGTDRIALSNANFAGVGGRITIVGGAKGNIVDATKLSAAHLVTFVGGPGKDIVTSGEGSDTFAFAAAALSGADRILGGNGRDRLLLTTAGVAGAGGVRGVETIDLFKTGADALALNNANFAGITGSAITVVCGNAGDIVDAAAVSAPHRVVIVGGGGADVLTGGNGNDVFDFTAANLTASDTVVGGAGIDRLVVTTSGAADVRGVAGVEVFELGGKGRNTLTLRNSNFTALRGTTITVNGGGGGNTISEASVAAADRVAINGGAGADTLIAGRHAAMKGGAGGDLFEFVTPGSRAVPDRNTIADFAHRSDRIAFSDAGFALGLAGASGKPKALPARLFSVRADGTFNTGAQRFAYNTATGALLYDGDGNGASQAPRLVATLAHHPALTLGNLFFVS
jgi:hypothetical protein